MMKARNDEHLRTRHFTRPVSVSINSSESRACSAPNVHGHSKGSASNRAPPVADGAVTKSQLNRIKQQAKAEAMKELKRSYGLMSLPYSGGAQPPQLSARAAKKARRAQTLALQNGGVGDGSDNGFPRLPGGGAQGPPGGGKGADKGKGKGRDTHNGMAICYNWNRGAPCKQIPCPMAHVCLVCKKDPPKKDHRGAQ